jgi:leucyl aminopeptidase
MEVKAIEVKVSKSVKYGKDVIVEFIDKTSLKNMGTLVRKFSGFNGSSGQMMLDADELYVGVIGTKTADDWRTIGFKVAEKLLTLKAKSASITVPEDCGEFMQGVLLGIEPNEVHKSKPKKSKLELIKFVPEKSKYRHNIELTLVEAKDIIESQMITKRLVDSTAEDANSDSIEQEVVNLFRGSVVDVEVYDEQFLSEENMRGHLAVNRASRSEAKTIKLSYYAGLDAKNIVLVGKGLTYDTGGLSIKPTNYMIDMKADKAGAMTLIGLMNYIAENGASNNITCYIALAENCIGPEAYRPGDVLEMKNGKTVMVRNTDAEGRLVLFDNLCLAQQQNKKIDAIYSIATLTGAAVFQFGDEAAGVVSFNDKMKKKLIKKGDKSGEIFMDAQFHKYMLDGVDDKVADLSNTGTSGMGCQKAGLFLSNSIKKKNIKKYLHIDIAGPAFTKGFGSNKPGASGFGVRTLINLVK